LISKRISLKKRKAPLSTQDVYTEATQLAHIKNPIKPQGTHKKTPNKHNRNLHKTKETPNSNPRIQKKTLKAPKPTPKTPQQDLLNPKEEKKNPRTREKPLKIIQAKTEPKEWPTNPPKHTTLKHKALSFPTPSGRFSVAIVDRAMQV
jgi:hypothetical protein